MTEEEQIDIIIDILTDFDEMGFAPTTTVPDPETYAIEWRNKLTDALNDYRNRQKAEIEFWKQNAFDGCMERGRIVKNARAEAVKEFAERLKEAIRDVAKIEFQDGYYYLIGVPLIDNLVKEFMKKEVEK